MYDIVIPLILIAATPVGPVNANRDSNTCSQSLYDEWLPVPETNMKVSITLDLKFYGIPKIGIDDVTMK